MYDIHVFTLCIFLLFCKGHRDLLVYALKASLLLLFIIIIIYNGDYSIKSLGAVKVIAAKVGGCLIWKDNFMGWENLKGRAIVKNMNILCIKYWDDTNLKPWSEMGNYRYSNYRLVKESPGKVNRY